jgi:hypothetical protein
MSWAAIGSGSDMTDEERRKLCEWLRGASVGWSGSSKMAQAANEIERLAALAQSDAEPTATRALLREARPYVASAKGDDTETHNFVDGLLRDIDAALAQSDAEPVAWRWRDNRYSLEQYGGRWQGPSGDPNEARWRSGLSKYTVEPLYAMRGSCCSHTGYKK